MARVSGETKQATRERLLGAAAEEFGRVGLERANVDAISLAAGFAKGTIYNYFPSKEELFLAVVEEAVAQATAAGSSPAEAPAREQLAATLAGFCVWAGEHDPFARVLVRECLMGTPGLYPRVMGAEAPLVGEFEAILRQGIARGELRDDVPGLRGAQQRSQQPSPRQLSRPSLTATAAITNAAAGSIHHKPKSAFAPRPINSAIERYAHSCVCDASLTAAGEFSLRPTRRFQEARSGMLGAVKAARPIPTQLTSGSWPPISERTDSTPT